MQCPPSSSWASESKCPISRSNLIYLTLRVAVRFALALAMLLVTGDNKYASRLLPWVVPPTQRTASDRHRVSWTERLLGLVQRQLDSALMY
jgi:hypothetical protein